MKKNVPWIAAALIIIIFYGTIYTVVQQSQRSDANYPQIQIAEDTASALNAGNKPTSLISSNVNLSSSLAPFTIIYNSAGRVVAGSGYLNDDIPSIPFGVLSAAKNKSFNSVTWQPQEGVRIAAVSVAADDYYVLSGRSLKEVENNENKTFLLSGLGGLVSLIVLAGAFGLSRDHRTKNSN